MPTRSPLTYYCGTSPQPADTVQLEPLDRPGSWQLEVADASDVTFTRLELRDWVFESPDDSAFLTFRNCVNCRVSSLTVSNVTFAAAVPAATLVRVVDGSTVAIGPGSIFGLTSAAVVSAEGSKLTMSDVHVRDWVPPPAAEDGSVPALAAVHVAGGSLTAEGCSWEGLGFATANSNGAGGSSDGSVDSGNSSDGGNGGASAGGSPPQQGSSGTAGSSPPQETGQPPSAAADNGDASAAADNGDAEGAPAAGPPGDGVAIISIPSAVAALYVSGAESVTLRGCTFANISRRLAENEAGEVVLAPSTAAAVLVTAAGAAAPGTVTVEGCTWRDVSATAAALSVDGTDSMTISNSAFAACSPGGALQLSAVPNAQIVGTVFEQNSATAEGLGGGGALRLSSCRSIELSDCVFTGNSAAGSGGAVLMSQGSSLRVNGGVLESNSAAGGPGGAVAARADFESGSRCALTLLGVALRGNSAAGGDAGVGGGAVYMEGGSLTMNSTEISSNTAEGPGGAVACAQGTTLAMHNCTLVANTAAAASGGAVWADARSNVTLRNSRFLNNSAALDGGAVAVARSLLRLASCTLVGNAATAGSGGAVSVNNCANCGDAGTLEVIGPARILGCEVVQNRAKKYGGGIHYVGGAAAMCTRAPCSNVSSLQVRRDTASSLSPSGIAYTRLADNAAGSGGGALYARFAQTIMDHGVVERNTAPLGGALFLDGGAAPGSLTYSGFIANVTFRGNECGHDRSNSEDTTDTSSAQVGGALLATRADGVPWQLVVNISAFEDNKCAQGGALAAVSDLSLLSVTLTNFSRNSAREGGGAVFFASATAPPSPPRAQLVDCSFVANKAVRNGGAVEMSGAWMLLSSRSNFSSNAAGTGGGALMVSGCSSSSSLLGTTAGLSKENARLLSGVLQSNMANRGGALRVDGCNVTVWDSRFTSNTASDTGGAILAANTGLYTITGLQVTGTAFQSNKAALSGGAVAVTSQGLSATNCSFTSNTARNLGGAIYAYDVSPQALRKLPGRENDSDFSADERTLLQVSVQSSLFELNEAVDEGGALALEQVSFKSTANRYLANSAGDGLQTSVTSDSGGAVYASACFGYATFDHDALSGNSADGGHGGAMLLTGCPAVVLESSFDNNAALGGSGGAIHSVSIQRRSSVATTSVADQSQSLAIGYTALTGNAAEADGGAVFANGVSVQLTGVQCSNNTARGRGGALAATLTTLVDAEDSSFTGNLAGGEGGAASYTYAALALMRGCAFLRNTAGGEGGGAVAADNTRCLLSISSRYDGNLAELGDGGALRVLGLGAVARRGSKVNAASSKVTTSAAGQDTWCSDQLRGYVVTTTAPSSNSIRRMLVDGDADDASTVDVNSQRGYGVMSALGDTAAGLKQQQALPSAGAAASADTAAAPLAALFVNDTLSGNAALRSGGAVLIAAAAARARVVVDGARVLENAASTGGGLAASQEVADVAMELEVFVTSSFLQGNQAAGGGGGALGVEAATRHQQVSVLNCTLAANSAADGGGAMRVQGNVSLLLGAASRVTGNTASAASGSGGGGGILAVDCNQVLVENAALLNNSAVEASGGAVLASGCAALVVSASHVGGNSAAHAGGVGVHGVRTRRASAQSATATATAGQRSGGQPPGNSAVGVVGARSGALAIIVNSSFTNNSATQAPESTGGALVVSGRAAALLSLTAFEHNQANLQGGGVAIQSVCEDADDVAGASPSYPLLLLDTLPPPTAFPGAQATWPATLAGMRQTGVRGCWQTVADRLSFYGNSVQGVGGSVYVERRELLSLVCDGGEAQQPQQQAGGPLGGAGAVSDAVLANRLDAGKCGASARPLARESLSRCYQLPAAADGGVAADLRPISVLTASDAAVGYGDFMGLPVSSIRVKSVGLAATGTADNSTESEDEAHAPMFTSSSVAVVLDSRSGLVTTDWRYSLTVSSVLPLGLEVDLLDALEQVASTGGLDDNATSAVSPLELRASLQASSVGSVAPCGAQLIGSAAALARNGSASLQGLRLRALKGSNYTLALTLHGADLAVPPPPALIAVTVPPCRLGEVPRDGGYLCQPCDPLTFSLWQDTQPLEDCEYASASDLTCVPCPNAAECPGGAVIFPSAGAWHSAANSTHFSPCPNENACRDGDDEAQEMLLQCQQWWYSRPVGFNYTAYAASVLANDSSAFPAAPGALPDGGYDYSDPRLCVLWGIPDDHPAAYMQKQCSPGHSGILCGVCVPRNGVRTTNNGDFDCKNCAPVASARVIFALAILSSIVMCVFTCFVTYFDDYTEQEDMAAGDMLGVLVRHIQYFYMLSRLGLNWPTSVTAVGAAFGAMTGAIRMGSGSATCVLPYDPSPEQQARAEVATELLVPAVSLAVALLVWAIRYFVWNARTINVVFQKDMRTIEEYRQLQPTGGLAALPRHHSAVTSDWGDSGIGLQLEAGDDLEGALGSAAGRALGSPAGAPSPVPAAATGGLSKQLSLPPTTAAAVAAGIGPIRPIRMAQSSRALGTVSGGPAAAGGGADGSPSHRRVRLLLRSASSQQRPTSPLAKPASGRAAPATPTAADCGAALPQEPLAAPATPSSGPPRAPSTVGSEAACALAEAGGAPSLPSPPTPPPCMGGAGSSASGAPNAIAAPGSISGTRDGDRAEGAGCWRCFSPPPLPPTPPAEAGTSAAGPVATTQPPSVERPASPTSPTSHLSVLVAVAGVGEEEKSEGTAAGGTAAGEGSGSGRAKLSEAVHQLKGSSRSRLNSAGRPGSPKRELDRPMSLKSLPGSIKDLSVAGSVWVKDFFSLSGHGQQVRWVSLVNVDHTLGLMHQLWLVTIISCSVLFPAWAQASLQIFSCYKVDPGAGPWPETQRATWGQGYWTRNLNQECYLGEHMRVWVPVGIVLVVLICGGIPLMSFLAIFAHRHSLDTVHVVQTYGFLYRRYNTNRHYWQVMTEMQTLLLVAVDVFGRSLTTVSQAVLQQLVLVVAMTLNTWFLPTKLRDLADVEFLSFSVLTLTISLGMLCMQPDNPADALSYTATTALGALILLLNAGLVAYLGWFTFTHTRDNITRAVGRVRQRVESARTFLSRSLSGWQDRIRKSSSRALGVVRRGNAASRRQEQAQPPTEQQEPEQKEQKELYNRQ
ncbi:hypothetical protein HYH02_014471 [Chlamydomonas schloesseri]|uniref:Right handed beta helix domain-containing protein n=1 Tax=Chlamydomonas schloesseri TaxID=2026947 RepID=A0A835VU94_9CHLO|nr:hypothetical protein HYH02_014471 [Chlamydomonas schloesseri]|eukprot:KAG2428080.1 hypothetical protein HYH02_014471 [Chlamydomonas schloesseri]